MTTRTTTSAPGLKAILGVVAAVLTYLATQEVLDLPVVADVAINAVGVGLAVYLAAPQPTITEGKIEGRASDFGREAGRTIPEVLLIVFLALLALIAFVILIRELGDEAEALVTAARSWGFAFARSWG